MAYLVEEIELTEPFLASLLDIDETDIARYFLSLHSECLTSVVYSEDHSKLY